MGSTLTSTSSLGFPGGSLGHYGTAGMGYVIVRLLGHNLDLVVRQPICFRCCNDGSVTSDVSFAIFLNYMSCHITFVS